MLHAITLVSTPLTAVCVCGSVVAVSCHVVCLLCPLSLCLPSGVTAVGVKNQHYFRQGAPIVFYNLLYKLFFVDKDGTPVHKQTNKQTRIVIIKTGVWSFS